VEKRSCRGTKGHLLTGNGVKIAKKKKNKCRKKSTSGRAKKGKTRHCKLEGEAQRTLRSPIGSVSWRPGAKRGLVFVGRQIPVKKRESGKRKAWNKDSRRRG